MSRWSRSFALFLLTAALPGVHAQDRGFRTWLWMDGKRPVDRELRESLKRLGITGVSAEAPVDPAPLLAVGIPYYIDQVVDEEVLGVPWKSWEAAVARGRGDAPDLRRPRCLRDPEVMERAADRVRQRLEPLRAYPPAFVSLRDEPSFTRLLNPLDWCWDPHSARAFVPYLEARWGSRAEMFSAWGLTADHHAKIRDLSDPTELGLALLRHAGTQAVRDRWFHGPAHDQQALVPWNDARAFADETFAQAVARLGTAARESLPGIPVGILGGQMPHAFGGFDWARLIPHLDILEVYDHGAARDIVGSGPTVPPRILGTVVKGERTAAQVQHRAWHHALRGDTDLVLYGSEQAFASADNSKPAPWVEALADTLKHLQSPGFSPWRGGEKLAPQVAILWSMSDIRLQWLRDTRHDGLAWSNRLSSYELQHGTQHRNREAWAAILQDLGLRYSFVTAEHLTRGTLFRDGVRALVLPRSAALGNEAVERMREFVQAGGLLIADAEPGLFTDRLLRRPSGALDALFGVRRRGEPSNLEGGEIRPNAHQPDLVYPLAESDLESVGATPRDAAGRHPAFLTTTPASGNQGRTLYLNLILLEYLDDRVLNPVRADRLLLSLASAFQRAGIRPFVQVMGEDGERPTRPVRVHLRRDGEAVLLACHVDLRDDDPMWSDETARVAVRLQFDSGWNFECLHGAPPDASTGTQVTTVLRPGTPVIWRLTR